MDTKSTDTNIKRIKASSNAYLVQNNGHLFMIDSGAGDIANIEKACQEFGHELFDLELIIITHAHWDHVANVKKLKNLTGALVIAQQKAEDNLLQGSASFPEGTSLFNKLLIYFIQFFSSNGGSFPSLRPDILVNEVFSLQNLGIDGRVDAVPGHTQGSLAVIIDSKHCFIGDTMFNLFPWSVYPLFANHEEHLKKSWQHLNKFISIETFYPGHGKPFSRKKFIKSYQKI